MGIFLMVRVKWCAIHVVQGMIKTKQTKKQMVVIIQCVCQSQISGDENELM